MDYVINLMNIPYKYYLIVGILFIIMLVLDLLYFGRKRQISGNLIAATILLPYLYFVLAVTILSRVPFQGVHHELHLFWSYQAYREGVSFLLMENILNVFMLMPIGLVIPFAGRFFDFKKTLAIGFCISLAIETIQLISERGLFELDDIFHNTLGVVIGYAVYKLFCMIYSKYRKSE